MVNKHVIGLIFVLFLCAICNSIKEDSKNADVIEWEEIDECLIKAVQQVDMRCKDLTEDESFFLQLDFTNCYLAMWGEEPVKCSAPTSERTPMQRKECSTVLREPENKLKERIFKMFYTGMYLSNLCLHTANQLWRQDVSQRALYLSQFSQKISEGLGVALSNNRQLKNRQGQTLENQQTMIQKSQEMKSSVHEQHKDMAENFEQLHKNVSEQASILKDFGSNLASKLGWVSSLLYFLFSQILGLESLVLVAFLYLYFFCLQSIPQARNTILPGCLAVIVIVLVDISMYYLTASKVLLNEETRLRLSALLRPFVLVILLLWYIFAVGRRVIRPRPPVLNGAFNRAEDFDTDFVIDQLVAEVNDLENQLRQSFVVSPDVSSRPTQPVQFSSPMYSQTPRQVSRSRSVKGDLQIDNESSRNVTRRGSSQSSRQALGGLAKSRSTSSSSSCLDLSQTPIISESFRNSLFEDINPGHQSETNRAGPFAGYNGGLIQPAGNNERARFMPASSLLNPRGRPSNRLEYVDGEDTANYNNDNRNQVDDGDDDDDYSPTFDTIGSGVSAANNNPISLPITAVENVFFSEEDEEDDNNKKVGSTGKPSHRGFGYREKYMPSTKTPKGRNVKKPESPLLPRDNEEAVEVLSPSRRYNLRSRSGQRLSQGGDHNFSAVLPSREQEQSLETSSHRSRRSLR